MEKQLIDVLIRYRYLLAVASIAITVLIAYGAKGIYLESDYKIYFQDDEPQLVAHEAMQEVYTKTDNLAIMMRPADGGIFTDRMLRVVHEFSELGWQTPYVIRVDSITNFQHTAADGDDLFVEDLLLEVDSLTPQKIAKIREIALSEKQLLHNLISEDGTTTLVNMTLELPPEVDPEADQETQNAQRITRDASHFEVVGYGREIIKQYEAKHPDIEFHIMGVSAITTSFNEAAQKDISGLVPLMYGVILFALALFFRSIGAVIGTFIIITCASIAAIGAAGWIGYALNTVNVTAPTIVLTIAVCDAVHLLSVYLKGLSNGESPTEAMRESFRLNLQPIILTSVTTAVGFFTLNFSISPPFVELGNMTALGVLWAMVLTFTLLPSVVMLITRKRKIKENGSAYISTIADFVIANHKKTLVGSLLAAAVLISFVPLNVIDDDPISYFKKGVPFRDASEFAIKYLPSVKDINFSIECGESSCISDPEFLAMLDRFDKWLEAYPSVNYVSTYVDVIKRLNRSMNRDDPDYYDIPKESELAAQYSLMYEMSLPYGLDLNNQLNLDKSSTKVRVLTERIKTSELIALADEAEGWLKANYREDSSPGSSVSLMFSHIGENNIRSMLWGGVVAIIGVTITILIALRSLRYASISLIPNAVPAFMAFGVWGLLVGQINMAVAAVFSISLGILVDDTVHFISKYRRAREQKGLSKEDAIRYSFNNVGEALIVTTCVLAIGFGLLSTSDFNLNAMSGTLTAITIVIALIFDFLILPPILMFFDRDDDVKIDDVKINV